MSYSLNHVKHDLYHIALTEDGRCHIRECEWCQLALATLSGITRPVTDEDWDRVGMVEAHVLCRRKLYCGQVKA
jgi:hypothetical protein